jgi:hypothetical protein
MPIDWRQGQGRKRLLAIPAASTGQHHQVGVLDAPPQVAVADEVQAPPGEDHAPERASGCGGRHRAFVI